MVLHPCNDNHGNDNHCNDNHGNDNHGNDYHGKKNYSKIDHDYSLGIYIVKCQKVFQIKMAVRIRCSIFQSHISFIMPLTVVCIFWNIIAHPIYFLISLYIFYRFHLYSKSTYCQMHDSYTINDPFSLSQSFIKSRCNVTILIK